MCEKIEVKKADIEKCDIEQLGNLRDDILNVANEPTLDMDFARAMEQLLEHIDGLIASLKTEKLKQIFPILGAESGQTNKMMISGMKHYRLCAVCTDCEEDIFKDLRITQLINLSGRDAPWDEFKVKCQKDPSHTVEMRSRYDTRSETSLPSFYRGTKLQPAID